MRLPSGEKATDVTELEWPSSVCTAAPPSPRPRAGPSCRLRLTPPACRPARRRPTLTESNGPRASQCGAPVAASQSRTVLSSEPDATSLPSGEKATALTQPRMALERLSAAPRRRVPEPDRLVVVSPTPPACRPARRRPTLTEPEWPLSVSRAAPPSPRPRAGPSCRPRPTPPACRPARRRPTLTEPEWPLSVSVRRPRGRVPEPDRLVVRARRHQLAVRREGDGRRPNLNGPRASQAAPPSPRPRAGPSCRPSPTPPACRPARRRPS